jgi:hypothetical protein
MFWSTVVVLANFLQLDVWSNCLSLFTCMHRRTCFAVVREILIRPLSGLLDHSNVVLVSKMPPLCFRENRGFRRNTGWVDVKQTHVHL